MPSSKEVRARQNRQKERVAAQRAEQQRVRQRRKRVGTAVGVSLVVVTIVLGFAIGGNTNNDKGVAVAPTSDTPTSETPTTTAGLASVKGKPCVGMKDPLP